MSLSKFKNPMFGNFFAFFLEQMSEAKVTAPVLSTYDTYMAHPRIAPMKHALEMCTAAVSVFGYKELAEILFVLDHLHVPLTATIANLCKQLYMVFVDRCKSDWSSYLDIEFYFRLNSRDPSFSFQQKLILSGTLSNLVSQNITKQKTVCDITNCECQTPSSEPRRTLGMFFMKQ